MVKLARRLPFQAIGYFKQTDRVQGLHESGRCKPVIFDFIRYRRARSRWRPSPAVVMLVLWGLFIFYGTTLPFDFSASGEQVRERLQSLAADPWHIGSKTDVVSNVLLFMPWGFLLAIWRARSETSFVAALILALLSAALLSVRGARPIVLP